jgi:glycosyltransferase involved in cell wall biosynthesis
MNLTLVSHTVALNDGQGRVNYEIARGALAAGWQVTIIAMRCAEDLRRHPEVKLVFLNVARLPTQLLRSLSFGAASSLWIRRHRSTIGILHVNGGLTWASPDVNSAHFVHGAWLKNSFFPFKKWWRKPYSAYQRIHTGISARWELPAYLQSRLVVAVSKKVAAELRLIGVPSEKITVIENGVDTNEFYPGLSERKRFGLPADVPLFLFVGDIRTRRKNLDTVLLALAEVPDLHLAVAGDLSGSPFPALAKKLRVSKRVHFLDRVNQMPALMRSVDAFVFPSRYDPMGLVLLEALASGLPILTAATAGGAEIMGSAGRVLQNPDDVQTLARWMGELKDDPLLRQSMGEQGRIIALTHNWKEMAEQYRSLYKRVENSRSSEFRSAWRSSPKEI